MNETKMNANGIHNQILNWKKLSCIIAKINQVLSLTVRFSHHILKSGCMITMPINVGMLVAGYSFITYHCGNYTKSLNSSGNN